MITENTNQRLQQASAAWSRLFRNTTPTAQRPPFATTSQTSTQTQPQQQLAITQTTIGATLSTRKMPKYFAYTHKTSTG